MIFPGNHMPTKTAAERKAKDAAYGKWAVEEAERIRRQRIYLTVLEGFVRDALVKRMLSRAWDLLDAGEAEAADALLEFVPAAYARRLLDEFFGDGLPTPAEPEQPTCVDCGKPRHPGSAKRCRPCYENLAAAKRAGEHIT